MFSRIHKSNSYSSNLRIYLKMLMILFTFIPKDLANISRSLADKFLISSTL